MSLDEELRKIAGRLKQELSVARIHSLFGDELSCFWGGNEDISSPEKKLHVENFASHFGFRVLINEDVTAAAFVSAMDEQRANAKQRVY